MGLHLQHGLKASKLPLLTKPIPMHKGGNGTGIVTCKNRHYLRKKSFFAKFFAHRTGREDMQMDINDRLKFDMHKINAKMETNIIKAQHSGGKP